MQIASPDEGLSGTRAPLISVALKEWAEVCDALGQGRQSILLRKGGIRERRGGFEIEQREFFLYPTAFHQNPADLVEERRPAVLPEPGTLTIHLFARVVGWWQANQLENLAQLADLHILAPHVVESRFHYRRPGLSVVLLEIYRLPIPQLLPERPEYAGCRSWVSLETPLPRPAVESVIGSSQIEALSRHLNEVLGAPAGI